MKNKAYSTGELPVFIISASREDNTPRENARDHTALGSILDKTFGSSFHKVVNGCYKGQDELSYVVNGDRRALLDIAAQFKQESILFLDTSRNASLIFVNGECPGTETCQGIGKWTQVKREEALRLDNWTYDEVSKAYYTAIPEQVPSLPEVATTPG